ncbi:MAG: hypothetical protein ACI4EF_09150 [Coprococcus sp.]
MKYKNGRGKRKLADGFAEVIYNYLKRFIDVSKINFYMRSIRTVSKQELDRICHRYYIALIKKVIIVIAVTLLLAGLIAIKTIREDDRIVLDRGNYGEDVGELELRTRIDNNEHSFRVEVLPIEYSESDMADVFDRGFEYIDNTYLGNNQGSDNITEDLKLVNYIDELGLEVKWISDSYDIINTSGRLTDDILEEPVKVELEAELSYKDYKQSKTYRLVVNGKKPNADRVILDEIRKCIEELQLENAKEQKLVLPDEINGYEISGARKADNAAMIILIGAAMAVLIVYKSKSDLKKMSMLRNEQLMQRYPEFVDKLSLYMGAGLSVRGALYKISEIDEKEEKVKKHDRAKYAHILEDEIKYTLNEIASGISEEQAYSGLGHRINISVYLKLTSLLSQNIKKGTKNVLDMLAQEETSAMQLKRELAKKRGEEAGTKLLFPMILLLAAVMVIVMLPALMSF